MNEVKKKILVVDDEVRLRENICELLDLNGFLTAAAENGQQAEQQVREFQPDLVICDIRMPLMDGYEFLQRLRENTERKDIPLIFISAKVERDDIRKGMNLGADDYLTKPFMKDELLQAVTTRLKRKEQMSAGHQTDVQNAKLQYSREEVMQHLRKLTKSERHILRRVAEGKTSRQISEELFISFKTVENHRSNISEKLGISGTLSLITYAFSIKPFLDSIE